MTREELKAMGLTDEQISQVLNKHHEEYDPVKKNLEAAQGELESEKEKAVKQNTAIEELKKDLEGFKGADVSGMQKKIEDLENDIKNKDSDYQRQIADRDFNDLLKDSISAVNGRNAKAIAALLDMDALKASRNQKEDVAAALKALTEAEDSKMLFGEPEANPVGTGNIIGAITKPVEQRTETLKNAIAEHYNKQ